MLRPVPEGSRTPARTLSSAATACRPSGRSESIFLPSLEKLRPLADISTELFGGPTACEASEALVSTTPTRAVVPAAGSNRSTFAFGSRVPNGLTPLNSNWARPFQKLRWLKTALMTEGVFSPVTWRVPAIGNGSVWSAARPGTMSMKVAAETPAPPTTSLVSESTAEWVSLGSDSRWNGKSAAVRV